jgi:hypothetical protein
MITTRGTATIEFEGVPQRGRGLAPPQPATLPGTATITVTSPGLAQDSVTVELIANRAPDAPKDLRCDGQVDPSGLTFGYPDLTWTFSDKDQAAGDRPSAYRLLLADNLIDLSNNVGNLWDTGKVLSEEGWANPCSVALPSGTTLYWKVMTWDVSGIPGPYSPVASFSLAGGLNYAVSLDPAGSVNFGQHPSLDLAGTEGITIEMWVYRTEENLDTVILDKFIPFVGGWRIGIDASDHVYFRTRKQMGGDRRVTAMDAKVPPGAWHHIACCQTGTAGGNDGIVYIDGVPCGFNGLINIPWPVAKDLYLFQSGIVVDELRISDTLRYTGGFTPPTSPFVPDGHTKGLWHFDEGQGTFTADESSNQNHGTLAKEKGWGAGYSGG